MMYKMVGSDKLYLDCDFPIENVNVDRIRNVFKLIEINVSEVDELKGAKRKMNFEKVKSYYKKPVVPPRFDNNNQNRWSDGYQGVRIIQERMFKTRNLWRRKCL